MRRQTLILIGLSLTAGLAAAEGVRRMAQRWEPQPTEATVAVVTMAGDVQRGDRIQKQDLTVKHWPKSRVPGDAVVDRESTIGRVATTPLISGQPVFQNFLAPVDAVPGLASLVPKGMRAFTIRTPNIASGVAGFVMPGNHVDVLLTVASPLFQTQGVITVTLLQRVEIMAVDQELEAGADPLQRMTQMKSVTLLVTPEQAAKLSLAQNGGTLELSLRNPADSQPASPAPITVADLRLGGELPDENRSDREKERQELIASIQEKMDGRMREMQRNLDQATKMLREASQAKVTKKSANSELQIRTLRGTHGGLVFVRPGAEMSHGSRE